MPSGRSFLWDIAMLAMPPPNKMKVADKLLPHAQRRRCLAKSNILCAGEQSDSLFLIIKGSVTILIEDNDGREMIVASSIAEISLASSGCLRRQPSLRSGAPGYAPKLNAKLQKSVTSNSVSSASRIRN
jgi:CRP-like cAMP-binding protein